MQPRTFCYVEKSLLVLTLRTELIFHEFIVLRATIPFQPLLVSEDFLMRRVICFKHLHMRVFEELYFLLGHCLEE